ncbi:hypothetical protein [Trinickia acidisoli]|uniref:hypothetical protein n=1 Tax=Trinickia acidisoli TaxID=2767482 RepID=UPI001A8D316C|nr:hypothetical protein [Trinickia acidisoli]
MADSALKIFGRWVAAALCVAAASIAHAQPPHGYRGHTAAPQARTFWRGPSRPAAVTGPRRAPHAFVMATDPYGHGGARRVPAPAIAPPTVPYRPVSEEARTLAREGGAAYLRAGSLRADIARYNEERDANRVPRPPSAPSPRPPQTPSVYYRN